MNTRSLPILAATLALAAAIPAHAATLAVLPGEAIQPKIDAAAPGDIIAIFGGTYPGDVTINKAVRLVEVDGQDVTITGNVTWTGVTNAPPFEGFTVGSSGKGITVTNTTGLVIKNVDARAGTGIKTSGASSVGVVGGFSSEIYQDGGDLTVNGSQLSSHFSATLNCNRTIALRTQAVGMYAWSSKQAWLGYSSSDWRFYYAGTSGTVVIVGSTFNVNRALTGIELAGSGNRFLVVNNKVLGVIHTPGDGRGVYVGSGNIATIANNYISMNWSSQTAGSALGYGVQADSPSVRILNNLIIGSRHEVYAPYGTEVRNNLYFNTSHPDSLSGGRGGFVAFDNVRADPLFVAGLAPSLQPSSPCINAGVSDPILNDLDGTRNDIGAYGGCLYNPQGWTTNKPVVISFDLTPQQLLKGVDTQINLSNGQAVAQP